MIDLDMTTVTPDEFAEDVEIPTCSECEHCEKCPFEDGKNIGFCLDAREFVHLDDEMCEDMLEDL